MNEDRIRELEREAFTLEERLAQPQRDRRRLEEIRKEIKALRAPQATTEFYCLGRFVSSGAGGKIYSTVVLMDDGSLLDLPPNFRVSDLPFSEDRFRMLSSQGRVFHAGHLNRVSLEQARDLKEKGLTIEHRQVMPSTSQRTYHPAQI